MKKFLLSFLIVLIFAGTLFIFGWVALFIPIGEYGVLISKTGGIDATVLQAGNFDWRWERLIPTNSQIRTFSAYPQSFSKTITGTLPSAEVYENMLEGNHDFSYRFSVEIIMNIKPEALPAFVRKTGALDQAALDDYLNAQVESIARAAVQFVLENSMDETGFVIGASLSETELIDGIQAKTRYPDLLIEAIYINDVKLPDIAMYLQAELTYDVYQRAIQVTLSEAAQLQGTQAAENYLELERFSRLGLVLTEYPILIEFMSVAGSDFNFNLLPNPQIMNLTE